MLVSWREVLESLARVLKIPHDCNILIVDNFLRFSGNNVWEKSICESVVDILFQNLKCARLSVCSSGPVILKVANRKTGIVFDISYLGYVSCMGVVEGRPLENTFRIIKYNGTNSSETDKFASDISEFLDAMDKDYLAKCLRSRSVVVNNQFGSEVIQKAIIQVLTTLTE